MNIVHGVIAKRVADLLVALEGVANEIIDEEQRKSDSTTVADLLTQREVSPKLEKKMGVIHIQLGLLKTILEDE